jgi:cell division protein FtsQ
LLPAQGTDILAHFGEDHFLERYQRYQAHIAEWRQQYPKLAAVDLRYDRQVVLEMASGVSAMQPTAEADGAKPSGTAPIAPANAAPSKPSVKGAPGKVTPNKNAKTKSGAKSSSNSSAKAKTTAAKNKTAQDKKRAQAKPVAQNANKQKPSPATHPAAAAGQ